MALGAMKETKQNLVVLSDWPRGSRIFSQYLFVSLMVFQVQCSSTISACLVPLTFWIEEDKKEFRNEVPPAATNCKVKL